MSWSKFVANPEISVVVTVVEGEPALSRCLEALARQEDAPTLEVIIPYDDTILEVAELKTRFPQFVFLSLGALIPPGTKFDPFVEHELFDRRRSEGLAIAKGDLLAILEDRGAPRPDWARAMAKAHAEAGEKVAVIGGAVINVAPGPMARALFICDYGRYAPPLPVGEAEYVTDINICYRRSALESVRDLWIHRYQETVVNWTLRDRGLQLILSPEPVVLHLRGAAPLARTLSERFQWGRVFGIQRGARWTYAKAAAAAAAGLVLPLVLLLRQTRALKAKGASTGEVLGAIPSLMLILPAWSFGEAIGYLQGAGKGAPPH